MFRELCHGCGACTHLCPKGAIREVPLRVGVLESGRAGTIDFLQGRLDVGRAMSPPIIRALKQRLNPDRTVIIDAPPGTSCPAVESVRNSDFCLLVTEPTPFGLHDLELAAGAAEALGIPRGVVINRADGGRGDDLIRDFCAGAGIPVLATIPFDRKIAEAYSRGETMMATDPAASSIFLDLFSAVEKALS